MKQFIIIMAFLLVSSAAFAQETEALAPTQLGQWTRPAATSIDAVDAYIAHSAAMYQEAMDIRAQFDAIGQLEIDLVDAANEVLIEGEDPTAAKREAYQAVIERILAQQEAAVQLPELLAAATASLRRAGLRAPAGTRAIASTREVLTLIVSENASLLAAAQARLAELAGGGAPVEDVE